MIKTLCSILAILAIYSLASCSNGDYNNNLNSTSSQSANPLNPLDSAGFNWDGVAPFSAVVDGVTYHGDSSNTFYSFSGVGNLNTLISYNGSQEFVLSLKNVYTNNIYNMGHLQYNTFGLYSDSVTVATEQFFSYNGNVGQVQVLQNDAARFRGKFYFQGVNINGRIVNVTNGFFNIKKP